jgi:cytochrome P450
LIASYEEILEPTKEKIIFFGMNIIFPQRLIAALPWKLNERLKETTNSLRRTCRQLVQDKKQSIANEKDHDIDILSILIKSNNFADDMLVDQLLTFLAAG